MQDASHPTRSTRHDVNFAGRLERLDREAEGPRAIDTEIVDLSTGGAALVCDQPLAPLSTWMLRLDPLLCSGFAETIVVRWCREEDDHYRCGVQFVSAAVLFLQAGIDLDSVVGDLTENNAVKHTDTSSAESSDTSRHGCIEFSEPALVQQLAHVRIDADQSLTVSGSVIECQANLGGPLRVGQQLAGGRIITSDTIIADELGHPEYTTLLVVGSLPKANALLTQVPKQLERYEQSIAAAKEELAQLKSKGEAADHAMRERTMELEFDLPTLEEHQATLEGKYEQLLEHCRDKIKIDIQAKRALHAGLCIEYNGQAYRFSQNHEGPLRVVCGASGDLLVAKNGEPHRKLEELAKPADLPEITSPQSDAA